MNWNRNCRPLARNPALRFFRELDAAGKARLQAQLAELNFQTLPGLVEKYVKGKYAAPLPREISPITPFPRVPKGREQEELYRKAAERGEQLLKEGKVAAFVVAGGQGTRLGYDGPKGEYPVTPLTAKPLFQVFAEQILAHSRTAGRSVPWYVMTSEVNDAPTRAFFEKHSYFGLKREDVFFFQQGMMPAFAPDGQILLSEKSSLALSPDGHGGSLRALKRSGALDDMKRRGVEHLSYFQIDNPIVQCIDPLYIGLHDLTGSEMSSKTISKAGPLEKVGNFCVADGKLQVIEYSDLPNELAMAKNADGSLKFDAGSIGIHVLRTSFVERLNEGGDLQLPWHRAEKKVAYVDEQGKLVKPEKPNAVKLEQFVFDAIPLARNAIVYTTERGEEFSPVKNADGTDSPVTCRRDQVQRYAKWLMAAGIPVARDAGGEIDAIIEISPLYATTAAELKKRNPAIDRIDAGTKIYIGPEGIRKF